MTAVDIPYTVTLDQEEGSNHISISSHPIVPCCVVALSAWARDLLLNFRFYSVVKSRQQEIQLSWAQLSYQVTELLKKPGSEAGVPLLPDVGLWMQDENDLSLPSTTCFPVCFLNCSTMDLTQPQRRRGLRGGGGWWCPGEVTKGNLTVSSNSRSCDLQHMMWWGLMPWLSHPTTTDTSSATPLSGTHQRDKADLDYWFTKND